MRSGSELIWNVSLVGQVRMQDVSGVWCNSAEEHVVCGAEQVVDGRQVVVAVAEPLAATSQDARDQWLNTYQTMPARRTQSDIDYNIDEWVKQINKINDQF